MELKIPMVLHTDFGSITLSPRMYELLHERQAPWLERCQEAHDGRWQLPYDEAGDLRRDEHLIAVVKQLEGEFAAAKAQMEEWAQRHELERELLHGLRVRDVTVWVDIQDSDGKETVRVSGGLW